MKDSRKRYSFIEKKHSRGGIFSTRLGVTACVLLAADLLLSFLKEGQGGAYLGAIAAAGALFAVYGFYSGMRSFSEKGVSPRYSVIGSLLSGAVMLGYLALFMTGISG